VRVAPGARAFGLVACIAIDPNRLLSGWDTPAQPGASPGRNPRFSGTGVYNTDHTYTWTVNGTVNWNSIWFSIVYTGTNAGYRVSGHGWIAADGSVSGTARDSNGLTLPFTMPAGSAFQVLSYQAPVRWAVINGHSARFGFTIPSSAPAALAGLPIVVKAHTRTRLHERHLCSRCRYELAQRAGHPVPDHERQHFHSSSVIE
jgi:hypothetical protein